MKVKLFESKEDKWITLLKKIQMHLKLHNVQYVYCHSVTLPPFLILTTMFAMMMMVMKKQGEVEHSTIHEDCMAVK